MFWPKKVAVQKMKFSVNDFWKPSFSGQWVLRIKYEQYITEK